MPALRAMLRLAWRDAFRNRARSLLIMALVGVPVAGVVGLSGLLVGGASTFEEEAVSVMGQADLLVMGAKPLPGDVLPRGTTVEPSGSLPLTLVDDGEPIELVGKAMSLDGLAAGRYRVVEGRAPTADGEVALPPEVLHALDAEIGDELMLADGSSVAVTGSIRNPTWLNEPAAVVSVEQEGMHVDEWLVDLPDTADATQVAAQLPDNGYVWQARESYLEENVSSDDAGTQGLLLVLGGLALLATGQVAAAAFAVSIRRRQRELGLVAATGGDARHLRHIVAANGIVLGGLGSVAGATLGIAVLYAGSPVLQRWMGGEPASVGVNPLFVLGAVCLGVLAATLAAWWPARTVERVPVMTALSGLRPITTSSRRGLLAGAALLAVGVVLMAAAIWERLHPVVGSSSAAGWVSGLLLAGSVAIVVGFGGVSPWVLERLGLLARRLPVGLRLAVRDVGRYRTRNGPVITAILGVLAVSVLLSAFSATQYRTFRRGYEPSLRDDQILIEGPMAASVAAKLAERDETIAVAEVLYGTMDGHEIFTGVEDLDASFGGNVAIGDDDLVRALGGGDAAVAALERGEILVFDDTSAGRDTVRAWFETDGARPIPFDATVVDVAPTARLASMVATADTLQRLAPEAELVAKPLWGPTQIARFDRPVTQELAGEARGLAAAAVNTTATIETGYPTEAYLERGVLLGSLLVSLLVLAIALALSATESHNDDRALHEIGADPAMRRRMAAGRALVLAGLGGLLAVPAGLLPAVGILMSDGTGTRLVVPWATVAVTVVGFPVIAYLGAFVLTRSTPSWTRFTARIA